MEVSILQTLPITSPQLAGIEPMIVFIDDFAIYGTINMPPPMELQKLSSRNRQTRSVNDRTTYHVAASRADREAAFRLVHEAYTTTGLMRPNRHGMRVTPYHLLPGTAIFNAADKDCVISTMSLICGGELGLPAEELYPQQLCERQRQGLRLAEVTCLASRQGHFGQREMYQVFVRLLRLMVQYARHNRIDRLIFVIHPKQQGFYERFLGCQRIGDTRTCPWVCNRPAVGFEHNFELRDKTGYRLYDELYSMRCMNWELQPRPISAEGRRFFTPAVESFAYFPYGKSA